jgi:hypothetical protein
MKTIIVSLCFFAVGLVIIYNGIDSLMMANQAKSWPTTEGTIKSSSCEYYFDWSFLNDGSFYFTHVNYSYTVAGTSYKGDRIAFGYTGSGWQGPNQRIADKLSSSKTVLVRYDPGKPSMAVLSCGLHGSIIRTLLVGTWIILVTAAVFRHIRRFRSTSGSISASWGSRPFKINIEGIGGIVLLVVVGVAVIALLGFFCDWGILSTIMTT